MREIVYSSSPDGDEDLYCVDGLGSLGGKAIRLTTTSGRGVSNRTPEWSPDRRWIAYQSNISGAREVHLLDRVSLQSRKLTSLGTSCAHPAWSPDGQKIVFVEDRKVGLHLCEVEVSSGEVREISSPQLNGRRLFNPGCFPAGDRVAVGVQGVAGQNDRIVSLFWDGSGLMEIGSPELSPFEFDISPDGREVVFDARRPERVTALGEWDIYLMASDGSQIRRLTDRAAMCSRPKWCDGGERIVFHTNAFAESLAQPPADAPLAEWFQWWNGFEICTMDRKGEDWRRLTVNGVRDLHPDG